MYREQLISTEQSGPSTSAGAWGLRHAGLVMGKGPNPPTTVKTWQIVTENPGIEVKVVAYPSNTPTR